MGVSNNAGYRIWTEHKKISHIGRNKIAHIGRARRGPLISNGHITYVLGAPGHGGRAVDYIQASFQGWLPSAPRQRRRRHGLEDELGDAGRRGLSGL